MAPVDSPTSTAHSLSTPRQRRKRCRITNAQTMATLSRLTPRPRLTQWLATLWSLPTHNHWPRSPFALCSRLQMAPADSPTSIAHTPNMIRQLRNTPFCATSTSLLAHRWFTCSQHRPEVRKSPAYQPCLFLSTLDTWLSENCLCFAKRVGTPVRGVA